MFDNVKKTFYFNRYSTLWQTGIKNGAILPFDDEFYNKMKNTYICSLPVYIWIKYFKSSISPGKCYDRSLYMFLCFEDATLVRGNIKELELKHGKDSSGDGWIEIGDYVYAPSLLMKIKKDLYYKIQELKKSQNSLMKGIKKCTEFYNDVEQTTIEDFMPNGRKRADLIIIIPIVAEIVNNSDNEQLKKDFNDYIKMIKYNEKQIYDELNIAVTKLIKSL